MAGEIDEANFFDHNSNDPRHISGDSDEDEEAWGLEQPFHSTWQSTHYTDPDSESGENPPPLTDVSGDSEDEDVHPVPQHEADAGDDNGDLPPLETPSTESDMPPLPDPTPSSTRGQQSGRDHRRTPVSGAFPSTSGIPSRSTSTFGPSQRHGTSFRPSLVPEVPRPTLIFSADSMPPTTEGRPGREGRTRHRRR
ncbi:hypothetical protein BT69DRAFT_1278252 [Atractiella rhizophila]|nr:hypothetical protein BT69DRAFT_1278252 [Atractiella rhizophila]